MSLGRWSIVLWGTLALEATAAQGAVFHLKNGGRIEGQLLNPDERPRSTYLVELAEGARLALRADQVDQVLEKSSAIQWYETWLPKMPNTVEGHWIMAEECRQRGLAAQREKHLVQILQLDPQHKEARYALGYSQVGGRWLKTDEYMQSQGYVRYRGTWRIAQDVVLETAAEEAEKRQKDWRRKISLWQSWILKQRGQQQEGLEKLRAIADLAAAPALIEILEDEEKPRELRMLCLDVLGKLQAPAAVAAFIRRALEDKDDNVRDACLDQLARFGTVQAARAFAERLKSPDNKKVNRAALCLAALKEPESALSLINALVTEHKFLVQQGGSPGQMNLGFGSGPGGGGNSFGVGGRPKLVKQDLQNEGVLHALIATFPGVNLGYDEDAWKRWLADQKTPANLQLRRDH